jgi:very-short-patch-repair endonuclease
MRTRNLPESARAQALRAESTDAETKLWRRLRNRRLAGAKFVRQAPIGSYYADFVCRACKLVVEVDGSQHADSAYDDKRDATLVALGYRVLRFWNADVLHAIDDVCETIVAALEGQLTPFERFKTPTTEEGAAPHPAPKGGRKDARLSTGYGATFSPPRAERRDQLP